MISGGEKIGDNFFPDGGLSIYPLERPFLTLEMRTGVFFDLGGMKRVIIGVKKDPKTI